MVIFAQCSNKVNKIFQQMGEGGIIVPPRSFTGNNLLSLTNLFSIVWHEEVLLYMFITL